MATDWSAHGCEECRAGVLGGRWHPPYLVAQSVALHARLHRCTRCQAWWEEGEREAHVIYAAELNASWGHPLRAMHERLSHVIQYLRAGSPLTCELEASPYLCEFWEEQHLERNNLEYELPRYSPGFYGFASSGGGELFAFSPAGAVVCLPAIGMEPAAATPVAASWHAFVPMLRSAAQPIAQPPTRYGRRCKPAWRQQYYRRQSGLQHLTPLSGLARTLGGTGTLGGMTTALEVLDSAVKIGLGAAITAVAGWLTIRRTQRHELRKAAAADRRELLRTSAKLIEQATASVNLATYKIARAGPDAQDRESLLVDAINKLNEARSLAVLAGAKTLAKKVAALRTDFESFAGYVIESGPNFSAEHGNGLISRFNRRWPTIYSELEREYAATGAA